MQGDKYRLGLDIPGFFTNLTHWYNEANQNIPDMLGYTKTLQSENQGIND